jgi:hypothetical protein
VIRGRRSARRAAGHRRKSPSRDAISELLKTLDQNPSFSGGLTLVVVGSAAAMLRRLPGHIRAFLA